MKNQKKKGFTLVELLVVIAIIAILSAVSVVGFMGFTEQARESNDCNELAQLKTIVLAEVYDGKEEVTVDSDKYTISYAEGKITIEKVDAAVDYTLTAADAAKAIEALIGSDMIQDATKSPELTCDVTTDGVLNSITYVHHSAAGATWTVATGEVSKTK